MKTSLDPLVSVVIITYNHAPFIAQAIQSVLQQKTSFPIEILIGEDGSNDGTRQIVCEFVSRYPRVVAAILRERQDVVYINGKPSGAFNAFDTMSRAKGRYIAYLEGDDYWTDPDKLQSQFAILESRPELAMCGHWVTNVDKHGNITDRSSCTGRRSKTEFGVIAALNSTPVHPNTWLFRRLDFTKHSAFNLLLGLAAGDDAMSLVMLSHGRGYCIPKTMSAYRLHGDGIWSGKSRLEKTFISLQLGLSQHKLVRKIYLPIIAWKNAGRVLSFCLELAKSLTFGDKDEFKKLARIYRSQNIVTSISVLPWVMPFLLLGPLHGVLRALRTIFIFRTNGNER